MWSFWSIMGREWNTCPSGGGYIPSHGKRRIWNRSGGVCSVIMTKAWGILSGQNVQRIPPPGLAAGNSFLTSATRLALTIYFDVEQNTP